MYRTRRLRLISQLRFQKVHPHQSVVSRIVEVKHIEHVIRDSHRARREDNQFPRHHSNGLLIPAARHICEAVLWGAAEGGGGGGSSNRPFLKPDNAGLIRLDPGSIQLPGVFTGNVGCGMGTKEPSYHRVHALAGWALGD
ncbi:hypothetical protein B0H14DRAFT_2578344 [Mycena olivaceomarginata]|nr:hypothetical protein B0H14DRAFT_2578344 [Mycena olivaceomarginata]